MKPATVLVRAARTEDARPVAEVHVASWRHAYRGLLPDGYLERQSVDDREAMWLGVFADPDAKRGAFVAEVDGRIVGFASFAPSRDEDVPERTGEIPAVYVDPSVLGTGVGRELFDAATVALRDAGFAKATLWVLGTNALARRFYEMAGWGWDGSVGTHMSTARTSPWFGTRSTSSPKGASSPPAARPSRVRRAGRRRTRCDRAVDPLRRTPLSGTRRPLARRRPGPAGRSSPG
jgi:GNAT superfamily N-acetyltransferase